jgi:putative oxidoreductase
MTTATSTIGTTHPAPGSALLKTGRHWHTLVPRAIVAVPLIAIGAQHLTGAAPIGPIIEAAGLPVPGLNAALAPVAEVLAGVLVAMGLVTRIGAFLALGAMLVAIYSHAVIDVWPITDDAGASLEPPVVLPIAIGLAAGYLIFRGGGRFSIDRRLVGA